MSSSGEFSSGGDSAVQWELGITCQNYPRHFNHRSLSYRRAGLCLSLQGLSVRKSVFISQRSWAQRQRSVDAGTAGSGSGRASEGGCRLS